ASYFQDFGGSGENYSLFQHAAEYVVTEIMLGASLRDGYEFLRELGFNEQLAWTRAGRHKFGFIDTSDLGDILKPAMYFTHEQTVRNLSSADRQKLLVGKINVAELLSIPEYKGRWTLETLTDVLGA